MKLFSNITFLFIIISLLSSCEKIIDLNLNDASKKYVIEGNISNEPGSCKIRITQTKDFNENNDFTGVAGAKVTMSDNGGASIPLTQTSNGMYESAVINGTPGHTYSLNININGTVFVATSIMPAPVNFDSLSIKNQVFFNDSVKVASVHYKDPSDKGNAYHFIQYKNNVKEPSVFVTNDDYTNGNKITTDLLFFDNDNDKKIKSGDTIKVVMECIDNPVYQYWFSIDAATGASNNATPANPVSNISGGALGYFSAHTVQTKSIKVP